MSEILPCQSDLDAAVFSKLLDDVLSLRHWKASVSDDLVAIEELAKRNVEMNLRLTLLVRLLISKGVITAEEYATMISDFRQQHESDAAANLGTPVT